MHASTVLTAIANAITPYIGHMMAQSSIEMHCKRIGITGGGTIDRLQLDELLRRLALGLNIFIGRDKTASVIEQIRNGVEIQP
jgi:hypothetical protein